MEFGIFVQGHGPGPRAHDREAEHRTVHIRATARPKFGPFEHEPPVIETIMTRR